MKKIIQYRCGVDTRGPYQFRHNTSGVYQVAAKNEKEARKLLQDTIGFGSITYISEIDDKYIRDDYNFDGLINMYIRLPYKMVKKIDSGINIEPHYAIDPSNTWDNIY